MAIRRGKGSKLQLSISSVYTDVAQLLKVTPPSMEMGTVETTEIDDTWREFTATLLDGGEVSATVNYDASLATHAQLWTEFQAGNAASWKVIIAGNSHTFAFSGIITSLEFGELSAETVATLDLTIKLTGPVTLTP